MSPSLVRLYPRAWRRRYGAEFAALLEQQPLSVGAVLDVVRGALDAHRVMAHQQDMETDRAGAERGKERVMKRGPDAYGCSFCGKSPEKVRRLIAGPGGVRICSECITLCNEIIAEEEQLPPTAPRQKQGKSARYRAIPWWQRLFGRRRVMTASGLLGYR